MLRTITDNLWVIDHPFKMMGIALGTRTTLIRLADGGLFMHSPGPMDAELIESVDEIGPVHAIVAPNDFHHLYIEENANAWPDAAVFIAPGLRDKRPDLADAEVLDETAPELWRNEIDQVWMRGAPKVNEIAFFHKSSRTLILADLAFNLIEPGPFLLRLFARINGASGRLASSRLMKMMYRDRQAARAGVEKILAWDFDRLTLCHGEIVESGAKASLAPTFDWLREI
ncbi:MAG: DUF4336 domain-containing protein [Myxococcota bacterium]|jgi:hypothetical protein|nr:DUF4336 domain-containing protein [Myxococcota bacterium]